ncbi:MAG: mannose-1-phosphate guanylyltransferase [Bryobacterales bacterium]|nr:mannose-1-phosphate guanylyltransferase [Acidobacteriota bacterium]MCB9384591.1 mannose-1-phosphate guanylyltransferase [Bryobacterales bacterium]
MKTPELHAVILAGGRGTRFWPRSRTAMPKQLLPVVGELSLLQQTVHRVRDLIPPERVWVITSELLRTKVRKQLPGVPASQIVAEPEGRNTAPAIALAAALIAQQNPDAVMAVLPSDHLILDEPRYLGVLESAARAASADKLVVLGIQPRYAETGYGYIEFPEGVKAGRKTAVEVVSFREKPEQAVADEFVQAGNFYWNSGQFLWRAGTILDAVKAHLPKTYAAVASLPAPNSSKFKAALAKSYPKTDKTSIDYGILEKASNIAGFPCKDFGWNDVGSWEAVYQLAPKDPRGNAADTPVELLDASGNYVDAPGKFVALVDVHNLIVVDTKDALLICPRAEAQKVSALVKALEKSGWDKLT